ncbi:MAG: glycosyltransferase [Thermoplasmatota archaeon]
MAPRISLLYSEPRLGRAGRTGIYTYATQLGAALRAAGNEVRDVVFKEHELRFAGRGFGGLLSMELQRQLRPLAGPIRHSTHVHVLHRRTNVLTLHDLTWFKRPLEYGSQRMVFERHRHRVMALPALLTVSQAVRSEVVATLGVPPERVHAIPLGVDHTTYYPEARERHPWFLFVGDVRPRKRLREVLQALCAPALRGTRLLRSGPPWPADAYGLQCRALVQENGLDVVDLGYQEPAALRGLYNEVAALVYPSEDEGFGIPPLEAAACGTGSVLTPLPVFDETVGKIRYPVKDFTVAALAESMERALRRRLPERDLVERAGLFTWGRCAEATAKVYDTVALRL